MTKGDLVFLYDTFAECAIEVRRAERIELIAQCMEILKQAMDDVGVELGQEVEILDEQEGEDSDLRYRDETELGLGLEPLEADHWDQPDPYAREDDMLGSEVD